MIIASKTLLNLKKVLTFDLKLRLFFLSTKGFSKYSVFTITLDNFVKENKTRVDMIKCDVEGSELFVFKGSQEVLQKDKPFIFSIAD